VERADSITWDPHKQFGVPIPSSLLFLQNKADFARMAIYGEYFNRKDDPEPNPGLKSPPSTRPLTALPLVTTIRYLGLEGIRTRLRTPLRALQSLIEEIRESPDIQIYNRPDTGILCFRLVPGHIPEGHLNQLQKHLYDRTKQEGKRSISMTRIGEHTVLRMVALSPSVTLEAMRGTVDYLRELAFDFDPAEV
jgi:glutamate/tyrosine decarboxylase-like PLP-dependent enzyme